MWLAAVPNATTRKSVIVPPVLFTTAILVHSALLRWDHLLRRWPGDVTGTALASVLEGISGSFTFKGLSVLQGQAKPGARRLSIRHVAGCATAAATSRNQMITPSGFRLQRLDYLIARASIRAPDARPIGADGRLPFTDAFLPWTWALTLPQTLHPSAGREQEKSGVFVVDSAPVLLVTTMLPSWCGEIRRQLDEWGLQPSDRSILSIPEAPCHFQGIC